MVRDPKDFMLDQDSVNRQKTSMSAPIKNWFKKSPHGKKVIEERPSSGQKASSKMIANVELNLKNHMVKNTQNQINKLLLL